MNSRIFILFFELYSITIKGHYDTKFSRYGQWKPLQAGFCVLSTISLLLWALPFFFGTRNAPSSHCILPALHPESATSLRNLVKEWYLEAKTRVLQVLIASEVFLENFPNNGYVSWQMPLGILQIFIQSLIPTSSTHTATLESPSHQPVQLAHYRVVLSHWVPKDHSHLGCVIYPHPKSMKFSLKFSLTLPPPIQPFLHTNAFHLLFNPYS